MNDAGQFGAFLSGLSGPGASGRSNPRLDDAGSGDRAEVGEFNEFFVASSGPRDHENPDAAEAGEATLLKRGEIIGADQDGLIAVPPATQVARDASADDLLGFSLPFPGGPRAQRETYYQTIQGRINDGAVNKFVTTPTDSLPGGLAALQAGERDFRADANSSLSTVKLTQAPSDGSQTSLNTVKLSAAIGDAGRVNSELAALTPFAAGSIDASADGERLLEFRSTLSDGNVSGLRNTPQLATGSSDAYNILAASFNGAAISPSAAGEIDILSDLALATSSGATRTSGAPAHLSPASSPSFTGFSSVLPQIQAAVIAGNRRDTVEVRLDPPDLGRVRIDFNVDGGDAIKAIIGADRSETLDHLRRNVADLEQQLKQAGFGSISFEFRSGGERRFSSDRDEPHLTGPGDINNSVGDLPTKIYLTMRENAQLDLLL